MGQGARPARPWPVSYTHLVKIPSTKAGKNLFVKTEVQGSGPALAKSDAFLTNYVVYVWSGKTHKLALSTYTSTPQVDVYKRQLEFTETKYIAVDW